MKYMEGWSWQDLQDCPSEIIPVIIKMIEREQREIEEAGSRRHGHRR